MSASSSTSAATRAVPCENPSDSSSENDLKWLVSKTLDKISYNLKTAEIELSRCENEAGQARQARKNGLAEMSAFWSSVREEFGEIIMGDQRDLEVYWSVARLKQLASSWRCLGVSGERIAQDVLRKYDRLSTATSETKEAESRLAKWSNKKKSLLEAVTALEED
ncbi:hypothetical protein DL98DRAFT_585317 [Cadophora sp. DSE1049]|nr:hypothetical protein DL98DRAFT_585317 [Cadophora sp. DSE1049]